MNQMYLCQCKNAKATGFPSPGGFTVCAGSRISDQVSASFEIGNLWYYKLRQKLIADGTIQEQVFRHNYEFSSPSAAAAVVLGRTGGGLRSWQPIQTETEDYGNG